MHLGGHLSCFPNGIIILRKTHVELNFFCININNCYSSSFGKQIPIFLKVSKNYWSSSIHQKLWTLQLIAKTIEICKLFHPYRPIMSSFPKSWLFHRTLSARPFFLWIFILKLTPYQKCAAEFVQVSISYFTPFFLLVLENQNKIHINALIY